MTSRPRYFAGGALSLALASSGCSGSNDAPNPAGAAGTAGTAGATGGGAGTTAAGGSAGAAGTAGGAAIGGAAGASGTGGSSDAAVSDAALDAGPPPTPVSRLSVGWHSCRLDADLRSHCWGENVRDEARSPDEQLLQIVVGHVHTCALRLDHTVTCWGGNGDGQATGPTGTFKRIATLDRHSCGIREDDTVACWGASGSGQSTPPSGAFSAVATHEEFSCGLQGGKAVCWGKAVATPTADFVSLVSGGVSGISTLSGMCGIEASGAVTCWGGSSFVNPTGLYSTWAPVIGCGIDLQGALRCGDEDRFPGVKFVDVGGFGAFSGYGCALAEDATVRCFSGKRDLPSPTTELTAISAGGDYWCGLEPAGSVLCEDGGIDTNPPSGSGFSLLSMGEQSGAAANDSELQVFGTSAPLATGPLVALSVGYGHLCAVKQDGSLYCSGDDYLGAATPPPGTGFVDVRVNSENSCALKSDGSIVCWGGLSYTLPGTYQALAVGDGYAIGIASDGTLQSVAGTAATSATMQLAPAGPFKAISVNHGPAQEDWACAIRTDDSAACWGDYGTMLPEAAAVPSGTFASIGVGEGRACGKRLDGSVVCWGLAAWNL